MWETRTDRCLLARVSRGRRFSNWNLLRAIFGAKGGVGCYVSPVVSLIESEIKVHAICSFPLPSSNLFSPHPYIMRYEKASEVELGSKIFGCIGKYNKRALKKATGSIEPRGFLVPPSRPPHTRRPLSSHTTACLSRHVVTVLI